jgi:uncharacterized protein
MKYLTGLLAVAVLFTVALTIDNTSETDERLDSPVMHEQNNRILIFSKTDGFRHGSIETGRDALIAWAEERGVRADATEDASKFNSETLALYDAIVFLNTNQPVFNEAQRAAFRSYIQNGGGFAGIHSATDTEYDWPWYNKLVGAYFSGHPRIQTARIEVVDPNHPSTEMLPDEFERRDEWYNFRDFNDDVTVLLALDPQSFEGSDHPDFHPIAWYHEFDGGRAFYTGSGHTEESYSEEKFMNHLWGGIEYVMGVGQ